MPRSLVSAPDKLLLLAFMILSFAGTVFLPLIPSRGSSAANSPTFGTPINISADTASAQDPIVQNVGTHVYVAWTERGGGIKFRASPDGGSSWIPPLNKPALKISNAGGTAQYPVMSANGTNVYVLWAQTIGSTGLQIMEATSFNNGVSFTTPLQLTKGTVQGGFIGPSVASWGNNVYVGYYDDNTTGPGKQSWAICSASAGAPGTWTKPVQYANNHETQVAAWGGQYAYFVADGSVDVTTNNCATFTRARVSSPLGSEPWVAAYGPNAIAGGSTKGNTSMIPFTFTNNNGKTWSKTADLNATNAWHPMMGAFGNNFWIAVLQHPGGSAAAVSVFTSTNAGTSWNAPVSLSGQGAKNSNEGFPFNVATTDGQNVFIAWPQQISTGYWVMRVSYSGDGGVTWTPAPGIDVSQNTVGQAGNGADVANGAISAFGTHAYVTWQYINGASNQIYFTSS